jgi:hypothetical protein
MNPDIQLTDIVRGQWKNQAVDGYVLRLFPLYDPNDRQIGKEAHILLANRIDEPVTELRVVCATDCGVMRRNTFIHGLILRKLGFQKSTAGWEHPEEQSLWLPDKPRPLILKASRPQRMP